MSVSWYDQFTGIPWDIYSKIAGQVTTASAIVISLVSTVFGWSVLEGIYTLFVGLLIAIWELPTLYVCIPQSAVVRSFFEDTLFFRLSSVRALVYVILSIFMFMKETLCIAVGALLLITSILLIFTAINNYSDRTDLGLTTDMSDSDTSTVGGAAQKVVKVIFPGKSASNSHSADASNVEEAGLLGSKKFGTF
jgi:hypothetical protein